MLKYFSILFFLLMATICSNASSQDSADTKTEPVHSHLAKELALAEQAQDYRLLVTATRGLSVPGLVQSEFK